MKPLVSVIIPNYNHLLYLDKRIKSVLNQDYENIEIILLDDFSIDGSDQILSKYSKENRVSRYIRNDINSGNTFIQWQRGFKLAKGKYVWIAESDDYCDKNFVDELVTVLESDNMIKLAYCQSNRVNENNEITGNWIDYTNNLDQNKFLSSFTMDGNEFLEKYLIYKNVIPNASAVIIRKDTLNDLKLLDTNASLKLCGDWLFYAKLIANQKVFYSCKKLNYFRSHSESVISSARETKERIELINVIINMRNLLNSFFIQNDSRRFKKIIRINNRIMRKYNYEIGLILTRNKEYSKGFLKLIKVFDLFLTNYKFKKSLMLKFKAFKNR